MRIRWIGHATRIVDKRDMVGNRQGKKLLGILRRSWISIKAYVGDTG
jgi:hypothetical protein